MTLRRQCSAAATVDSRITSVGGAFATMQICLHLKIKLTALPFASLPSLFSRQDVVPEVGMRQLYCDETQKYSSFLSATLLARQSFSLRLSFPALSWGQCTPVFASFASTETDDGSAGSSAASPSFSSIRPSAILFFSFFFLFLRPRRRDPFSPSFRDVFLALRLAASLFPTLSPGEDSSIRAQPLAYNETENLSGTRGMRHMITYIETKNRPARRSAALSLFPSFSLVLLFVSSFAFRKHRDTSISRSEQSQRESDSTIKYCLK